MLQLRYQHATNEAQKSISIYNLWQVLGADSTGLSLALSFAPISCHFASEKLMIKQRCGLTFNFSFLPPSIKMSDSSLLDNLIAPNPYISTLFQ